MKYYYLEFYHSKIKVQITDDRDIQQLVNNFIKEQNKGEAKSDRIHIKTIKVLSEQEFNNSGLPDESYLLN